MIIRRAPEQTVDAAFAASVVRVLKRTDTPAYFRRDAAPWLAKQNTQRTEPMDERNTP